MSLLEMVGRLALAVLAGGLVGLERERRDRPAGLRTHIVVCVGATLVTLVSVHLADNAADRTRIAAQIVSGIGFLGAGTIFRAGNAVKGLTTAAGLWTVAGIGMAIGAGGKLLWLGLITAAAIPLIYEGLRTVEDRWLSQSAEIRLGLERGTEVFADILDEMTRRGVDVHRVIWLSEDARAGEASVCLRLTNTSHAELDDLVRWLAGRPGVRRVDHGDQ
jgi:putative Mg2+ transporter-C (MgtC) family protein